MMGVVGVQIVSTVRQMEVEIRGIVASVIKLFAVDVNPIWITLESVNTAWKHESMSHVKLYIDADNLHYTSCKEYVKCGG